MTAGAALITWDAWWGAEFQTARGTMETHKAFQITPDDPADRGFEIRSRFVLATAPDIARIDGRTYAPIAVDWMNADGPHQRLGVGAFWLEYNSSQNRKGRELVGHVRNLVILKRPRDVETLFEQPTR